MTETTTTAVRPRLPLTGGARPARRQVIVPAITLLAVLAALTFQVMGRSTAPALTSATARVPVSAAIEARYGIRITKLMVTANGGIIDMRFTVLDADLAHTVVHGSKLFPTIVDERTGGIIHGLVMGMGPHHLVAGRGFYLLYRNDGGLIRPGGQVSVQVGSLWLRHVPVL